MWSQLMKMSNLVQCCGSGRVGRQKAWRAQARLTSHYSVNRGFVGDDGLIGAVSTFRNIPCIAVQGGNDLICPPFTAFELHEAWPEMELRIVPGSGHGMYDAGLQAEVLRATDRFRDQPPISTEQLPRREGGSRITRLDCPEDNERAQGGNGTHAFANPSAS